MSKKKLISIKQIFLITILVTVMLMGSAQESQNDANSGGDAPDDRNSALPISADVNYTGTVGRLYTNADGGSDYSDYYSIVPPNVGFIRVYVEILNPQDYTLTTASIFKNGSIVASVPIWSDEEQSFTLVVPLTSTNELAIEISSYDDSVYYLFEVEFNQESYSQNDAGSGRDSSSLSPVSVNLNTSYSGSVGNGHVDADGFLDELDYFMVDLPSEGYLNVSASIQSSEEFPGIFANILTSDFSMVYSESNGYFSSDLAFAAPIVGAGTYYLEIGSYDWNASYDFMLEFTPVSLPIQHDGSMDGDAPSDFDSAEIVGANSTTSGTVGEGLIEVTTGARDEHDYYRIEPITYGQLDITLTLNRSPEPHASVFFDLYNHSDLFVSPFFSFHTSVSRSMSIILTEGDAYYFDVWAYDFNISYTVQLSFTPIAPTSAPTSTTTTTTTTPTTTGSQSNNTITDQPQSTTSSAEYTLVFFPVLALVIIRKKKLGLRK